MTTKQYIFTTIFSLLFAVGFSFNASAASIEKPKAKDTSYKAVYYNQSVKDPITIEAGKTKEVIVRFKNTGSKNWASNGYTYVSVYTINDKYRTSQFSSNNWIQKYNPVKLSKDTSPGNVGEFKIKLNAPNEVGEYKEDFYLAAENTTWIEGGYFYLKIKVVKGSSNKVIAPSNTTGKSVISGYTFTKYLKVGSRGEEVRQLQTKLKQLGYFTYPEITTYFGSVTKAAVVAFQKDESLAPYPGFVGPGTRSALNNAKTAQQAKEVEKKKTTEAVKQAETNIRKTNEFEGRISFKTRASIEEIGGKKLDYLVMIKNSGTKDWNGTEWKLYGLYDANGKTITGQSIGNNSWLTNKSIAKKTDIIKSGENLVLPFSLNTPAKSGKYTVKFRLNTNGKYISGSELVLSILVTTDADASYTPVSLSSDSSSRALVNEPDIKVGLYSTNKTVKFLSKFDYLIYTGDTYHGLLEKNTPVTLSYLKGVYTFKTTVQTITSTEYIKLEPNDKDAYFEITNYSRTLSYRPSVNYNAYRGALLYKYSNSKALPYVVNELPLDEYILGIAETDNASHYEYIKAVLVAARSYAYFNIYNGTPQERRTFDVYGSTIDQLYLGYNSETAMPNVAKAAKDSYGQMVTYNNKPVITPYFGHSDGYTRGWKEVWGGSDKAWLKPVEAKYDKGESMHGHGVGMSCRDASFRAVNDNWDYEKILNYYYTDTEVEQIY